MKRGEIHYVNFPYTFDTRYPHGKKKFVLVLQDGEFFDGYDTVSILLVTTDKASKGYLTNVTVEKGTTKMHEESYIICAQVYTVRKSIFKAPGAWKAGEISPEKLVEVDTALVIGLCIGRDDE